MLVKPEPTACNKSMISFITIATMNEDDEDDDDTFHDAIQVEDVIEDTNDDDANTYGDPINNEFIAPVGQEDGATGVTIEHEGVLHAQYCHYGVLYYQSCEIYGDDPAVT